MPKFRNTKKTHKIIVSTSLASYLAPDIRPVTLDQDGRPLCKNS